MKRYVTLILVLLLMLPASIEAQRRKKPAKKAAPQKEEVVEEDPRIQQMLSTTQQIVFIDSLVVDKDNFIDYIPLSPECGTLAMNDGLGSYTNELNDHTLVTTISASDSTCHILSSNLIDTEWTSPTPLNGIGNAPSNFPYLMPDGTTLYYAQRGEMSIGGYDIFVTRYDAERNMFLRAENLGMPFASEANDYLYVIDETYQLGYFVTDRRQPSGKVCIYVFIPATSRRIYQSEAYSDEQLRALAGINRIADTWGKGSTRDEAIERWKEAKTQAATAAGKSSATGSAHRSPLNELDALRLKVANLEKSLQQARANYARATNEERAGMRNDILRNERELEDMQRDIKQKIKEMHNNEHRQ